MLVRNMKGQWVSQQNIDSKMRGFCNTAAREFKAGWQSANVLWQTYDQRRG